MLFHVLQVLRRVGIAGVREAAEPRSIDPNLSIFIAGNAKIPRAAPSTRDSEALSEKLRRRAAVRVTTYIAP